MPGVGLIVAGQDPLLALVDAQERLVVYGAASNPGPLTGPVFGELTAGADQALARLRYERAVQLGLPRTLDLG